MKPKHIPAAIIASVALAACGSSTGSSTGSPSASTATASAAGSEPAATGFNDADVAFAQSMIEHHQQAMDMADRALDPTAAASPEVKDLAQRIKDAQGPEISMMGGWLERWQAPMTMDSSAGHSMHGASGMMSAGDMDQLMQLTGPAFDQAWLEGMIEHHRGAITMAEQIRDDGESPDVATLADQVIATQQSEVDEMNGLLAG